MCKAGFKYPGSRNVGFSGGEVESASAGDYAKADAFQCVAIQGQSISRHSVALGCNVRKPYGQDIDSLGNRLLTDLDRAIVY